ncbi:transcription regulator BDF1, putative [Cordyceps militaris CM01]|uniref:Transcription regulator BDF1, putative n=1 Tax=Cordyceps militaris (strain CM01) TaxID=983644 RepID=G3J9B9_CORMM|nr:transcription regulator BDF1, putative [Cordyceps militaris CM01]EGX94098.1 transcription regulator BDF1, putative [Cordyceps militaris CM01]
MEWPKSDAPAPASAPASETKPLPSPSQSEQNVDSNGLAAADILTKPTEPLSSEPSATAPAVPVAPASSTAVPAVNGSAASSEHDGTNGISHPVELSNEKPASQETTSSELPTQQVEEEPTALSSIEITAVPVRENSDKPADKTPPGPAVASAPKPSNEDKQELALEEVKEGIEGPKEGVKPVPSSETEDTKMDEPTVVGKPNHSAEPAPVEPSSTSIANEKTPTAEPAKIQELEDVKMEDAPEDSTTTTQASVLPTALQTQNSATLPTSEVDLQPASLSQLNIETQPATSPITESVEVDMSDAPAVKVAREREDDDAAEEPAAKRARTEPEEDKPMADRFDQDTAVTEPAAAPDEAAAAAENAPGLDTLPNWNDPEANGRPFSAFQRREVRKTIGRLKKTKGGGNFRDAVIKLWPQLREAYLAKVETPMDLSEIDRNVREGEGAYVTFGEFKNKASLIYLNALTFNGPTHDVTFAAFNVVKALWEELLAAPAEEPPKPKAIPKAKPIRESRIVAIAEAPASRRTSTGPRGSPSTDADAKSAAGDRRGSAATEADRPKRTVRAPKPKDIDYTTKPSRKKLKPELQFAMEVLGEVMHPKYEQLNTWFLEPVDAEGLNIPDYYSIIKKPMDLGKVSAMLSAGDFANLKDFDKHIRLVFENCYSFNGPPSQGNPVSQTAAELEAVYTSQMKTKDAWLAKFAKANAPTSADVSDEEDDEEDIDDGASAEDNSKEMQELQAKLDEETKKLHAMFVPGANQSMIDIQKGIVDMVQQALIKAVASAGDGQPKNDKSAKKAKAPKGKSAGGRKSTGAVPGKKAGGGKKGAAKKSLTASDKDHIANAINDLEYPHLDRAIDIIKKDTGQNENNDGELELDIDQLSNDALLKLWELCKKVLPGFAKDSGHSAPAAPEPARPSKSKTTAGKPKKNKPMSAQEQEARIAQLTALRQMYKDGGDGPDAVGPGGFTMEPRLADSSDDSDSEEE